MSFSEHDMAIMARLIDAASQQKGYTLPNPVTAAAVVKQGKILSEGTHKKAGEPHAEAIALDRCGAAAQDATLYITLEPCTHWGKQPPCVERILTSGISEVIYAIQDPNPRVQARSANALLESAGIRVRHGLLEKEALYLNESFFKYHTLHQPFITLKAGMSLDGKIALSNGESKYITSSQSRQRVHALRREHHALLIGVNTIITDNPLLNIREEHHPPIDRQRYILILDVTAKLPLNAALFDANPTDTLILLTAENTPIPAALESRITAWKFPVNEAGKMAWSDILHRCYDEGIYDILIEGGTGIYSSALEQGIVDKVDFFMAPKVFGGHDDRAVFATRGVTRLSDVTNIHDMHVETLGPDIHITGYLRQPHTWWPLTNKEINT